MKLHRLSERFAPYACAMFCSKRAYVDFVASHVLKAETFIPPLDDSSRPLWAVVSIQDWPTHDAVVTDVGRARWDQHGPDVAGGHLADHPSDLTDGHHVGAGGHDGSDHGGAGGDSSQ
jgi:hypothetical protein